MPGEQTRKLWCLLNHDPAPFAVIVNDSTKINHLKEAIKKKNGLRDVGAPKLILWQVRIFYRPA